MTRFYAILTHIGERKMNKITTEQEALAAIREDGMALQEVPENLRTAEVCLEVIGWALDFIALEHETAEIYLETWNQCKLALGYVPENLKTAELKEKIDLIRATTKEKLMAEMRKKFIDGAKEFEEFLKYAKSQ
jgi:hypothetical protein